MTSFPEVTNIPAVAALISAPAVIERARYAAVNLSDSYRVKVGAAMLACDPETQDRMIFYAANHKPTGAYEVRKYCAERKLFNIARASRFTYPELIVTAGPGDVKIIRSITGRTSSILDWCDVCTDVANLYEQEGKLGISGKTPVITTIVDSNRFRLQSVDEMTQSVLLGDKIEEAPCLEGDPDLFNRAGNLAVYNRWAETARPVDYMRYLANISFAEAA